MNEPDPQTDTPQADAQADAVAVYVTARVTVHGWPYPTTPAPTPQTFPARVAAALVQTGAAQVDAPDWMTADPEAPAQAEAPTPTKRRAGGKDREA